MSEDPAGPRAATPPAAQAANPHAAQPANPLSYTQHRAHETRGKLG
jgi:hypothetical protein